MPGLFVALAVLATIAFAGTHAKKTLSERVTLTPGKRWLVTVSFLQAPEQSRFSEVFRSLFPGIESITWPNETRASIVVVPIAPITLDVGTPGPGGLFMFSNVSEAPPLALPEAPPAVSGERPGLWFAQLRTAAPVLDKPTFERALVSRMKAQVVLVRWKDSRHLGVVFISRPGADPRRAVGLVKPVRGVRTTVLSVRRQES